MQKQRAWLGIAGATPGFRQVVFAAMLSAASVSAAVPPGPLPDPIFAGNFEFRVTGSIGDVRPAPGSRYPNDAPLVIDVGYQAAAPVPPQSVFVWLDGVPVTATCLLAATFVNCRPATPPAAGPHTLHVAIGSLQKFWRFDVVAPPTITALSPASGTTLPSAATAVVEGRFAASTADIDPQRFTLLFDGVDVTPQAAFTLETPRAGTFRYAPAGALAAGTHRASVVVRDTYDLGAVETTSFVVDTPATYTTAFVALDAVTLERDYTVRVAAASNKGEAEAVSINGRYAALVSIDPKPWVHAAVVRLQPGANPIDAEVTFENGEVRHVTGSVTYDAPPVVTITSPADWQTFGPLSANGALVPGGAVDLTGKVERPVTITGTVSRPAASVLINQQQATLSDGGTRFAFERFFLHEGTNLISANATDTAGRVGSANITLYADQTAPLLTVEAPQARTVTSAAQIDVRGVANDAVEAGVRAPEPVVVVRNTGNNQDTAATVIDRYYLARAVPLQVGRNVLTVTATDALGNARTSSVEVSRIAAGSSRITLLSGQGQASTIGTPLADPLTVAAFDANGLPLADLPIRFDVLRGSGSIGATAGAPPRPDGVNPARNLVVRTDSSGRAGVWLTLGSEAVAAGNMVRASADTLAEDVVFTATGTRGAPALVSVFGAGGSQFAPTNGQPVEALAAVVLDAERNPIPSMTMEFLIDSGDARFTAQSAPGGQPAPDGRSIRVITDKNGVASVRPLTGAAPGNVQIRAVALPTATTRFGAAIFHLIVLEQKNAATRFSGVVLDHTGAPLAGVRLEISRASLSTVSDAQGRFRFDDQVPPGKIDLQVDGRNVTARRGGQELQYPIVHFETAVVQGQDNQLPHPIYLPPVNLSLARIVGGDEDVTLTVPGMEGFEMVVKAHSVTFPDGSRVGPLVVTPVHADRLPMVPPSASAAFGAIAWTIQPTNTRFDPPIEVRIPNAQGMKPGETAPIVQWDHDLAAFVPMGNGTVSEDGTRLVSDPGSGITKAGWGGCVECPPPPPNCGTNPPGACRGTQCGCPDCNSAQAAAGQQCPACAPDITLDGTACDNGNACKECTGGSCNQKFNETPGAGVSAITFPAATLLSGPLPLAANAYTYALPESPAGHSEKADWKIRREPYCDRNGKWKFAITAVEFQSKIVVNATQAWLPLTSATIANLVNEPGYTICRQLDGAELDLRSANSSHYVPAGTGNTAVSTLIGAGVVGFPAGTAGMIVGKTWNTYDAIVAHERVHEQRLQRHINNHAATFFQKLGNLETPIQPGDKLDAAGKRAINARVLQDVTDAMLDLTDAVVNDEHAQGSHSTPDEFYNASMGALSGLFADIAARRTALNCGPPGTNQIQPVIWLGDPDLPRNR